jgi:hypothetical protein
LNDNPPRFDSSIYEVRIPEDVEIGKVVLTVKATDLDSRMFSQHFFMKKSNFLDSNLRYYLYSPGSKATKIPFGVKTDSGAIYVKDVLDYEDTNVYYLELMSSDGKHNTTTGIRLFIEGWSFYYYSIFIMWLN